MKYQIQLIVHGATFLSAQEFPSRWDAQVEIAERGYSYASVVFNIPTLNGWIPDETEVDLLNTLAGKENRAPVTAIKFIRGKAKCGLKEAKDYFDTYFRA